MSSSSRKLQSIPLRAAIAALCAAATMNSNNARAADVETPAATDSSLDEVIVTGSRTSGLKAADSPAPIQLFSAESLERASGSPDLQNALAQLVPSLTLQAFGFDMAGQTLQTKLRGLSPNHVLVLINGKRRHGTANLAVDTGSPYQGGAGADLNFIPLDAIDHIEVLTDGAAAQYGSDAIAGVINIILKKNNSGGKVDGTWGNYYNTGGNTNDVGANLGLEPLDGGYLNITGENRGHGHSFVGAIDERVINPSVIGTYPNSNLVNAPNYPYVNRISGDGQSRMKTFVVNAGFDFANGTELYAFGTYGDKNASSFENTRLPSGSSYTQTDGTVIYQYPFGFQPQENSREKDSAATVGVKGSIADWNWDVSSTYGVDKVDIRTLTTTNEGLFALNGSSPTDIGDGFLRATQWTNNVDINRNFEVGLAGPLNVAFGGEFRRETYQVASGDPASYVFGGGQGYAGFSPTDAGVHSRKNESVYVDLAVKPITGLQIDIAGRFEHYSDFGNAKVGKLTARYDFTPEFAVRGTVSNGFRAPTLAEEYYSSTNVGPTSAAVQLPPNSPAAKLLGLNGLQPEHSVNLSLGLVWRPVPGMIATVDAYQIQVTNRIVGSGEVYSELNGSTAGFAPAVNAAILLNGNQLDPAVTTRGIEVFSNGPDTITRGVDLVFDFPQTYDFGKIDYSVGATYNATTLTRLPNELSDVPGQPLYDLQAVSELTTASPRFKINLGAVWTLDKLSVSLAEQIYGKASEWQSTAHTPTGVLTYFNTETGITAITNLDISYTVRDHLTLSVGANNLFNRFPNKINGLQRADEGSFVFGNNSSASQYPLWSPFGVDGGFYYIKGALKF